MSSHNTLKTLAKKLKECDIHEEFYNTIVHSYSKWAVKFNTQPIPKGKTFDDFTPTLLLTLSSTTPSTWNLQPWMPAPLNQGTTGACVAVCVANAIKFWYTHSLGQPSEPDKSILFIYYNSRLTNPCCYAPESQPSPNTDSGSNICASVQVISKYGACDNAYWPFDTNKVTTQPTPASYNNGQSSNQIVETRQINQDLDSIKYALYSQKYPIIVGFTVFPSYLSPTTVITGNISYPSPSEQPLDIGHVLLLTGYDDSTSRFNVQNSYGSVNWGIGGYGTIPYEYILNPTLTPNDLWIVGNGINVLV
jgi:hypothetical protein